MSPQPDARRTELAARLEKVRDRIARACEGSERDPSETTLVAVTKFFPASDVALLAGLGVTDVGENRDQEAGPKIAEVRETVEDPPRLHFIGQLQTNKAASVAAYADVVHSVDRMRLVRALERGAARADRRLDVLLQVDLEEGPGHDGRGGASPDLVADLAAGVAGAEHLRLRGLMAVAPLDVPARPAFQRLAQIATRLREQHPEATWLSAGMSADLEDAVACGATHLRVGTAILGARPDAR